MIYVMSDIHGQDYRFFKMLDLIGFSETDTLYILGDIIDRGDGSFEILEFIKSKSNIIPIMGNHEQMMICGLAGDKSYYDCWVANGGVITLSQFEEKTKDKQLELLSFIDSFKLYEEVRVNNINYILCHAGLNIHSRLFKSKDNILKEQNEWDFLWTKDFFTKKSIDKNNIVIFGHTNTFEINAKTTKKPLDSMYIWYDKKYKDKIGIDCGAGFVLAGGRLGCLRLDDMKEFYM